MVNLMGLLLRGLLAAAVACSAVADEKKDYVVYLGKASSEVDSLAKDHARMIAGVVDESYASRALIRSYGRSFNGLVAKLTENEANVLAGQQGVVWVFPDRALRLHTTRSWDFLGLSVRSPRQTTVESDIIIGVIDTGIWPESESFNDEGFGPPPKKWKGACKGGANFTCNNKLIGARFYRDESARDYVGHGSHTASTAAGRFVQHASFYGLAEGIARGGVPSARIAAYRACSNQGCLPSDILSSFDDAIADGVDIITASLGSSYNISFDEDPMAIRSFHAMEKGILTTQSAGNDGSYWHVTTSTAPWNFSVAARSIDRKLIDGVTLENGITLTGRSINGFPTTDEYLPIIYGAEVGSMSSTCDESSLKSCHYKCLDNEKVTGKIVLWDLNFDAQQEPPRAGAAGVIMPMIRDDVSNIYALPSSVLNGTNYNKVQSYHEQTRYELVILPDVSAPGVDILAAFSSEATPSFNFNDSRRVSYSFISVLD
ncbi:hypothetical protein MLD38_031414 [Melastoma candidum]|uniref:Uncharacterized protein n=1 Tax=Melastoma candidum TaxID=119954 RepID=A0ACB9MPE9_9MYRT|nr:hypothetical protein MLD38_031414 [Melastoma candidum]